ncbi:hypothetical protein Kpol_541p33 [Vanderwaltozyma polyspora DSM 70294]|uniref:Zn(2)-C6 fungal-type domain-containing protein n=1 Tax=Vanderwaltozyma polyspora (strain ATCC 22028 / DSM 70294 / BCRC 21397 / CBS 2163 / NBRC 10782 / NRRL Y-8283 / UCD 57-17) TaxID=436907 RepID=A7TIX8_VANPO|nr:uncharacterized protein Kpol_541p33 [Vanderwaltozyma polyspora DSM 70294]EDO17790.1 hypothetical protein Kpol_541p33 [Vanderwaltozyma polyspora DSM 70294]
MFAPSITLRNKDHSLPPLLLPNLHLISNTKNLKSTVPTTFNSNDVTPSAYVTSSEKSIDSSKHFTLTPITSSPNISGLDKLATIAINDLPERIAEAQKLIDNKLSAEYISSSHISKKRKRRSDSLSLDKPFTKQSGVTKMTPAPSPQPSQPASLSSSVTSSPQSMIVQPLSVGTSQEKSLSQQTSTSNVEPIRPPSKRQRIGPSCDGCRLKKIKCNASIETLYQDRSVIPMFSNLLHHKLGDTEIQYLVNDPQIRLRFPSNYDKASCSIVKHIDKIMFFKPCTSCIKRKNTFHDCLFSKGFTRIDINIFNKINNSLLKNGQKEKTIFEVTVDDYRNTNS